MARAPPQKRRSPKTLEREKPAAFPDRADFPPRSCPRTPPLCSLQTRSKQRERTGAGKSKAMPERLELPRPCQSRSAGMGRSLVWTFLVPPATTADVKRFTAAEALQFLTIFRSVGLASPFLVFRRLRSSRKHSEINRRSRNRGKPTMKHHELLKASSYQRRVDADGKTCCRASRSGNGYRQLSRSRDQAQLPSPDRRSGRPVASPPDRNRSVHVADVKG